MKDVIKDFDDSESKTLSWGRLGPEILGTTLDKSKSKILVKEILSSAQSPCSLEYFSTSEIVC